MRRLLLLAILATAPVITTVAPLPAADPPPALASSLHAADALCSQLIASLHAADPRLQAWAAYAIASHRLSGAREALLPLLAQVPAAADALASTRYRSALDALICLDGPAPPAVVAAAAADPRFQTQALILAARRPADHLTALVRLLDASLGDAQWLATCELLETEHPPQLAGHLLGGLTLRLAVDVFDPQSVSSSCGSFSCGASRCSFPDGFPPYALYVLTTTPERGATVLTSEVTPVYWVRAELATSGSCYCVGSSTVDRDAARIALLSRITNPWSFPDLKPVDEVPIPWQDAGTYRSTVVKAYAHVRAERQYLVDGLIQGHLLAADAATRYPPRIEVTIDDRRLNRSIPLPELPFPSTPAIRRHVP